MRQKTTAALALGAMLTSSAALFMSAHSQTSTTSPAIASISPSSTKVGAAYPVEATITGHGFAAEGNVVRFGPVSLTNLHSPDGRTIKFGVPKIVTARSEVPPMALSEGTYEVSVIVEGRASNTVTMQFTR